MALVWTDSIDGIDWDELVARGHKKIFLYAVPGKEGFYARLGFRRMTTAMAIFDDKALAARLGYLDPDKVE